MLTFSELVEILEKAVSTPYQGFIDADGEKGINKDGNSCFNPLPRIHRC
jgi:hypothetical protein